MRTLAQEWGRIRVNVNAAAFGVIQTRFGLPQSDHEVIETGGRTIHVGMPAKQAARMGVRIDPDSVITDAETYAAKPLPGVPLVAAAPFARRPTPSSGCAHHCRTTSSVR